MKAASFFFEKKIVRQKSKHAAFHPGPVLPPGGEGSPLEWRYRSRATVRIPPIVSKTAKTVKSSEALLNDSISS